VMLPGIHQPTSQCELVINKKAWKALPDDLKVQLETAVNSTRLNNWLWMEKKNIEAVYRSAGNVGNRHRSGS